MNIGLFFGSFNPIHIGHLIIANSMLERSDINQLWFVVSPQNPFKKRKQLLHEFDRIDMVRAAIHDNYGMKASDVEFNMPKPSYTVDTLAYLSDRYPEHHFKLILGEDNLKHFPKWKNYEQILDNYGLYIYPRPNSAPSPLTEHKNVTLVEAPLLDISATYIRRQVEEGHSIKYLVHDAVDELIQSRNYYK